MLTLRNAPPTPLPSISPLVTNIPGDIADDPDFRIEIRVG